MTKNIPEHIPQAEDLLLRFEKMKKINIWIMISLSFTSVFFSFYLILKPEFNYILWLATASILVSFILFILLDALYLFRLKKTRLQKSNEHHIGKYTVSEIQNIVKSLFKEYGKREIPNIYIYKSKEAELFVNNSLIFNFFRPFNAIYISSVTFHILEKDELKALISHELGHFYQYTMPLDRASSLLQLFIGLLPVALYNFIGIDNLYFIFIFWGISFLLFRYLASLIGMNHEFTLEYLSDYWAAKRHGKITLINGLLLISKSTEIIEIIYELILENLKDNDKLSHKSFDEITIIVMKKLPTRLMTTKETIDFVRDVFKTDEVKALEKDLDNKDLEEKESFISDQLRIYEDKENYQLLDWNLFDFNKKDLKIDEIEYPKLIETILKNPEGQMFNLVYDHEENTENESHPTIANRILFLEKNV